MTRPGPYAIDTSRTEPSPQNNLESLMPFDSEGFMGGPERPRKPLGAGQRLLRALPWPVTRFLGIVLLQKKCWRPHSGVGEVGIYFYLLLIVILVAAVALPESFRAMSGAFTLTGTLLYLLGVAAVALEPSE